MFTFSKLNEQKQKQKKTDMTIKNNNNNCQLWLVCGRTSVQSSECVEAVSTVLVSIPTIDSKELAMDIL